MVALVAMATLSGCSDSGDGPSSVPTTAGQASSTVRPPSSSTTAAVPGEADAVADAIGCSDRAPRSVDPSEPVSPLVAFGCVLGEGSVGIQIYGSNQERDEVIAYLDQFSGFRVVGDRWIAAVDTPEMAEEVSSRTGGRIVALSGRPT
jgi:hypothetical protein